MKTKKALLEIIKWTMIGFFMLSSSIIIILIIVLNMNTEKKLERFKNKSEEIINNSKEDVLNWYEVSSVRGEVKDRDDNKYLFLITMYLGYPQDKAEITLTEIENKKFLLKDMIIVWFSQKSKEFLIDIKNKTIIRYNLIDIINKALTYPISDIRFTNFQLNAL